MAEMDVEVIKGRATHVPGIGFMATASRGPYSKRNFQVADFVGGEPSKDKIHRVTFRVLRNRAYGVTIMG